MTHDDDQGGPPVLVLVRDLIFASRITATASDAGVGVRLIRDPAKLGQQPGARLIVDLNLDGAIEAARQWRLASGSQAVGFVSHVDTATIAHARAAGIDRVLARSRFVELLPDLLRGTAAPEPGVGERDPGASRAAEST